MSSVGQRVIVSLRRVIRQILDKPGSHKSTPKQCSMVQRSYDENSATPEVGCQCEGGLPNPARGFFWNAKYGKYGKELGFTRSSIPVRQATLAGLLGVSS